MSGTVTASARLLANKELVLDRWIAAVRSSIPLARAELDPVLIDTFPAFITHLAEALAPRHPRTTATEGDMVAIARACVDDVRLAHGDCCVVAAEEPVVGYWSPAALTRVFENLLSNALKYRTGEKPVTVRLSQSHGRAIAHVHNHGSYIPPSEQGNLFQAFTRSAAAVSSTARGWGIGLAIVRAIADAHGGSVGIDSLPETGTAFIFDIPLDARPFQRD